jgi:Redoxin.
MTKVKLSSKIFFLLVGFSLCVGLKAQSTINYDITFRVHYLQDTLVYIKGVYGDKDIVLDSMSMQKDSTFRFKKNGVHQGLAVFATKNINAFTFVLDKDSVFSIEVDPFWNFKIKGSRENDIYFEYQKANSDIRSQERSIKQSLKAGGNKDSLSVVYRDAERAYSSFVDNFYTTYPQNIMTIIVSMLKDPLIPKYFYKGDSIDMSKVDTFRHYFRIHYWDNFPFTDQRLIGTPYFFKKFNTYIDDITYPSKDSLFVSLKDYIAQAQKQTGVKNNEYVRFAVEYMIRANKNIPFSDREERFVCAVDLLDSSDYDVFLPSEIEQLRQMASKVRPLLPDNKFVNITFNDLNGKSHSLYDQNHAFTVVYFFASSCHSCKVNIDVLEQFYASDKQKYDVEIFAVDLDNDLKNSINFAKERLFPWIVVKSTNDELKEKYGLDIPLTPDLYILDKDKKIINHTPVYKQVAQTIENFVPLQTIHK